MGPSGFVYVTSNGTSLRNAAQFTLRRRLYAGLMASVAVHASRSRPTTPRRSATGAITPASLSIAQNWLDLGAERGPSSFDQRHRVAVQVQYTTGVGLKGGTLVDGFWGSLFKDWTVAAQLNAGSGMPFTPVSFLAVAGTGVVGMRPIGHGRVDRAGVCRVRTRTRRPSPRRRPATWGNAGRNSIRGPAQFSLDMSVSRVFRLGSRLNLEWRVAATNVLNRVTFATIDDDRRRARSSACRRSPNPMRTLQMTVRLRF